MESQHNTKYQVLKWKTIIKKNKIKESTSKMVVKKNKDILSPLFETLNHGYVFG